jgi:hypothetical protein
VNTAHAIKALERQNEFLNKEIASLENRLADYRHRADQNGILTHVFVGPPSSDFKTASFDKRIAQLKSRVEKNTDRISKLQQISSPCSPRDRFGFITAPHVKSAKEIAEDAAEDDLNERYEAHMRRQNAIST